MNDINISRSVTDFNDTSFGEGTQCLIDSGHPSPPGVPLKWAYCLTDVTGFSAASLRLTSSSGTWPVELGYGTQLPSDIMNVTVTTGTIIGFIG